MKTYPAQKNNIRVVLIGRTQVGKSTLFNRLIGKRYAIEGQTAHTTRDARVVILENGVELVDLPGLEPSWLKFHDGQEQWQTLLQDFVRTADIYLWVVDGQHGLIAQDIELFRHVGHKPWVGVVNKLDHANIQLQWEQQKGIPRGQWFYISASHKMGVDSLKNWLLALEPTEDVLPASGLPIRIAVVGRTNAGKSSFCNQALGAQRVRVESNAHTTRDIVEMSWPILSPHLVTLIDTAGMLMGGQKRRGQTQMVSELQARRAIERCEYAFFMLDASRGISDIDIRIYHYLKVAYTTIVLIVNKWDLQTAGRVWKSQREARKELGAYLPDPHHVIFHSTKAPFNSMMFQRLLMCMEQERQQLISTRKINDWIEEFKRDDRFKAAHQVVKVKYAVQKGVRPQRIYCFGKFSKEGGGKKVDLVRKSLLRSFQEYFKIRYGPVFFSVRKL